MDERTARRFVVDLDVEAAITDRLTRLTIYDLSSEGCMTQFPDECPIRLGERVAMQLPHAGRVVGEIAWEHHPFAGIRFGQPIHMAIVMHLGFRREDRGWPTMHDSFGRPLPALGSGYA